MNTRKTRSSSKRLGCEDAESDLGIFKKRKCSSSCTVYDDFSNDGAVLLSEKVNNFGVSDSLNLSEDSDFEENYGDGKESCSNTSPNTAIMSFKEKFRTADSESGSASDCTPNINDDAKPVTSNYFDFSEILSFQKATTEFANHTSFSNHDKTLPDPVKRNVGPCIKTKSGKKKRSSKAEMETNPKAMKANSSKGSVCNDGNSLSVAELLLIGENITNDKDIKQLNSEVLEEPIKSVEITIKSSDVVPPKKRKKKTFSELMTLKLNAKRRETQVYMHKVHILCWLAHGFSLNKVLNCQDLLGTALSLIPSKHCYPPKHVDIDYLQKLTTYFHKKITINPNFMEETSLSDTLSKSFDKQETLNKKFLVFMFICVLRALGLQCRLILNLVTVPLKLSKEDMLTSAQISEPKDKKNNSKDFSTSPVKNLTWNGDVKYSVRLAKDKMMNMKSEKANKSSQSLENSKKKDTLSSVKSGSKQNSPKSYQINSSVSIQTSQNAIKTVPKSRKSSETINNISKENIEQLRESFNYNEKSICSASCSKNKDTFLIEEDFTSEESDSELTSTLKKKKNRKVLSSDDENYNMPKKPKQKKQGCDVWAEVFAEAEEKWISVDVISTKIHVTQQLYNGATHPAHYIFGWNNDQSIKDVTRRYVTNFNSLKSRVDENWLKETLLPYGPPNSARNREEEEDLCQQMYNQPVPSSIAEYKNHPLYVLKRHLLKYEAIYPPDAPTLGFVKEEPIYSRECVKELHSRETWLKQAKLVRVKETPYKLVKRRPKYDKLSQAVKTDSFLELFGEWQTEDYIPPIAKDGIVPRNAYGNVDLFKLCMLPTGTVYLELPGLYRIARKLNIDCAAAVTGFDFHSGGSHPIIGGFVICEEFKDIILDAWNEEMDNTAKREEEKRIARVYKNWRRLIKGIMIFNRVKSRYKCSDSENYLEDEKGEPKSSKKETIIFKD